MSGSNIPSLRRRSITSPCTSCLIGKASRGSEAVDHAIHAYERLRQAYPGKRIVIAEFGWPSAGLNRKDAVPSPLTQAEVIRDFITRADAMGIDYSIVEAFDQPWKTNEGSVGPYWGIFNADRHPKFSFAGSVEEPNFLLNMIAGLAMGLLFSIPIFTIPRVATRKPACLLSPRTPSAPGRPFLSTIGSPIISCSARRLRCSSAAACSCRSS